MPSSRAALIVNTRSRRGRAWYRQAESCLRDSGIDLVQAIATRDARRVISETALAVQNRLPLVVVGGGDGTLSAVARHFIGSKSVLGVLPLGTGNQFARDLCIPTDVDAACEIITGGEVSCVDVGTIGDDYFLNVATVGLTTRIVENLTVDAKRKLGRLVYLFALTRALRRSRPFNVKLTTDQETNEYRTLQVVVGNGRFHAGPFPLAPEARITDGKLVVYVLNSTSRMGLLRFALRLPGGHHVDLEEVPAFWTTQGRIETAPVERVTVDGEIEFRTPVDFGIAEKAIRVMTPPGFEG